MNAAFTCSRRKMYSKVWRTDDVPAPDEPVTEMMGCLIDIGGVQTVIAEEGMDAIMVAPGTDRGVRKAASDRL